MGGVVRGTAADEWALRRLRPLLCTARRSNGVTVEKTLATTLQVAYFREELRMRVYRRVLADVLATLAEAGVPTMLVGGAALGGTVYGDWALRHSHDIDLLVLEDHLSRGAQALAAIGFTPGDRSIGPGQRDAILKHVSDLPVALHSRPFPVPYANALVSAMWARGESVMLDGVEASVLSPADNLLHVCGRAAISARRGSPFWVCDAWQIIEKHPDLDWELLVEDAWRCHLSLLLYATLRYLASELEAPIPPSVVRRLATAVDPLGREGALRAAQMVPKGSLPNLFRLTRRWEDRARLLKWWLLPSPSYLRAVHELRPSTPIPLYYLSRPFRYGARRVSAAISKAMPTRVTWRSRFG